MTFESILVSALFLADLAVPPQALQALGFHLVCQILWRSNCVHVSVWNHHRVNSITFCARHAGSFSLDSAAWILVVVTGQLKLHVTRHIKRTVTFHCTSLRGLVFSPRMVLSEKAKGKQRAVDPEPNGSLDSRDLTIRFTEGLPDLALNVTDTDTVRLVKAKVSLFSRSN